MKAEGRDSALRWALLVLLAATLGVGCATSSALSTQHSALREAPSALSTQHSALPGWHEVYVRPGWEGGPAVDLRVAGDVMLGRHVAEAAARRGADYPFSGLGELLAGDVAIVNLESPLTDRRDDVRPGPYRLLGLPAMAAALGAAGVDVASLANNHALDAGPAGLDDTLAALHAAGVAAVGAGKGEAARAPAILEAGGLRVAVLAFNDVVDPADGATVPAPRADRAWRSPDVRACPSPGDVCPTGRAWLDAVALDAVTAAQRVADVVVVLPHWGVEYAAEPSARQREWAADLVAAGADLVVGAHTHVLQPAERVEAGGRVGFVAYSLGNLVFDAPDDPALSSGMVLRALVDAEGVALVTVAPVATAGGRPVALTPQPPLPQASPAGEGGQNMGQATGAAEQTGALPPSPVRFANGRGGAGGVRAWAWNGAEGVPVKPPATLPPPRPDRVPADLRGDGEPLWAMLDADGMVTVRDGAGGSAPVVWRNEDPAWRFTRLAAGDADDDGRVELLLLLWQRDGAGRLRTQPYLLGWRGGRFKIIWGGSATATPIQDLALADLDADGRNELVVLEGGELPGDPGEHVAVWRWHGWGYELLWRSPPGRWSSLALADGTIVAAP